MKEVKTTLEVRRGPGRYVFEATNLTLAGVWDGTGKEQVKLEIYNFMDANGDKWIKFEEPCPQIRWAGKLSRNFKASVIKDLIPVPLVVFNPKKSEGSLEALASAKDERLNSVNVWYREMGEIEWALALSKVEALDSPGQFDYLGIDFANPASPEWKEDSYGYSAAQWDIGEQLAMAEDGMYEVMVESLCDEVLGAPSDFNAFSPEYLTLVVDRVEPEMYGKALPIRDVVVPGEEVVIAFTEDIRCTLPFRFDLQVLVAGLEDVFDERNLKIDCTGRKLGFQFDPVRIDYSLLMGREMTVSLDNVKDIEGNKIPYKIEFSKTIADLDLVQASTTFDFTLQTASCADPVDTAGIKDKIALELALSDTSRVDVLNAVCQETNTVATVSLSPKGASSQRRLRSDQSTGEADEHDSLSAFYFLLGGRQVSEENSKSPRQLLGPDLADKSTAEHYIVSRLLLHPGENDIARYSLDAQLTHEEEMILAAAAGYDKHELEHQQHMHLFEKSLNETGAQLLDIEDQIFVLDKSVNEELHAVEGQLSAVDEQVLRVDQKMESKFDEQKQKFDEQKHAIDSVETQMHSLDEQNHKLEAKLEEILSQVLKDSSSAALGDRLSLPDDAALVQIIAHMEHEQHNLEVWLQICSFLLIILGSTMAVWMRKR